MESLLRRLQSAHRSGVLPLLRPLWRRIVEELEQAPQLVSAGTAWVRDEILDEQREPVTWNLPEVLSEHRPHTLQDEVAPLVGTAATPLPQTPIQLGHHTGRAARDRRVPVDENGLLVRQEQQRVIAIGQLNELKRGSRIAWKATRLTNLEALERAEDHETWGRYPPLRIGGVAPVVERLLAVMTEPFRLRRRLHLDDADPRPQEVEETASCRASNCAPTSRPSVP
jgi:hypothetical protein